MPGQALQYIIYCCLLVRSRKKKKKGARSGSLGRFFSFGHPIGLESLVVGAVIWVNDVITSWR